MLLFPVAFITNALTLFPPVMRQATAMRQFAQSKLYAAGQNIDSYYAYSGASARQFTSDIYNSGAGNFQSNCKTSSNYSNHPIPSALP